MLNRPIICDISRYQVWDYKQVDFEKMKSTGAVGVIARCTVGDYYTDTAFHEYYRGAKAAGLLFGAYMVVAPKNYVGGSLISWQKHVERFLREVTKLEIDFPYVLDCELTRGANRQQITALIQNIAQNLTENRDLPHMMYTRQSWWDGYVLPWSGWKKYDLHAARYISGLDGPWADNWGKFRDWDEWKLWQYSADGNGVGKDYGVWSDSIDLNQFNGSMAELYQWLKLTDEPPVVPDPEPEPEPLPLDPPVNAAKQKTVTASILNIRSLPNVTSDDVGDLAKGSVITIVEEKGDWVRFAGGWVHKGYLE